MMSVGDVSVVYAIAWRMSTFSYQLLAISYQLKTAKQPHGAKIESYSLSHLGESTRRHISGFEPTADG